MVNTSLGGRVSPSATSSSTTTSSCTDDGHYNVIMSFQSHYHDHYVIIPSVDLSEGGEAPRGEVPAELVVEGRVAQLLGHHHQVLVDHEAAAN